ncbi:MAG: PHP domain-containing protein, partial [Dehalococcoidia bacterium]|nr:PHP domain-containing protein [Dehalococcoidia bacterium]
MPDYAELHCHSYFSLRDGASPPEDLVLRAAELGMPALALTDHNGLYGAIPFYKAGVKAGIRPLIGAEVTLAD